MTTDTLDTAGSRSRPDRPAAARAERGRVWLTVLLCVCIFAAGGIAGVGATLIRVGRQAREALEHPETLPARVAARLQSRLDLTDEQTERVEEIVRRRHKKLLAAREELMQNVDPEMDGLEQDILEVLGPDKGRRFSERMNSFREEWLPHRPHARAPHSER